MVEATAVVVAEHADLTAGLTPEQIEAEGSWLTYHEWYVTDDKVGRDRAGRLRVNSWDVRWRSVRCNNPDCPGRVDVREDVLASAATLAMRFYGASH